MSSAKIPRYLFKPGPGDGGITAIENRIKDKALRTPLDPLYIAKRILLDAMTDSARYAHGRLLDVGCGSKPYKYVFEPHITEYVGMDLPSIKSADVHGDVQKIPFKNGSFDTVLCTEVLEHVPQPDKAMAEMARVLKKGGHLILTAPQVWGLHDIPYDYYRYTPYGLRYLAEKAGLKVINIRKTCGVWAMAGQRVSSNIYYKLGRRKGALVTVPLCLFIQMFSLAMDELSGHDGDTLDNILIAKK